MCAKRGWRPKTWRHTPAKYQAIQPWFTAYIYNNGNQYYGQLKCADQVLVFDGIVGSSQVYLLIRAGLFEGYTNVFTLMFCVVWDNWNSKQKAKQYKQKNLTTKLQNSNQNSCLSWVSLIALWTTWPRCSAFRLVYSYLMQYWFKYMMSSIISFAY